MADPPRPHLLRDRREAYQGVELAFGQESHRLGGRVDDEVDVLPGIKPDVRSHGGDERVVGRAQGGHGHGLPLEVTDCPHAVRPKQLVASDVNPGQKDDRLPRVDLDDERGSEGHADLGLARAEGLVDPLRSWLLDVPYVGKTLGLQQLLGDVLRRDTDARDLHKPDPGRLQGHLRRRGIGSSPEERSRSAERCRVQELASVHALSSFFVQARRELLPASGTEVNCSIFAPAARAFSRWTLRRAATHRVTRRRGRRD